MSTRERLGPVAPTRLVAEPTTISDRFEMTVRYSKVIRKFLMIDCHARPRLNDRVMVKRLTDGKLVVQRFRGQKHLGVVRILKRFQLHQSVFWPSVHSLIWFIGTITI